MIALLAQYWSRFLSSTALPKAGPHYPDPERSVGVWYRKMGLQECWEAIGPARDIYLRPLSREIRSALEDRIEFLYQGESVTRPVTFSVYMIGRTKTTARPTIMFCCESPGPRRRARQVINDSALLQRYPGFTLGDSSFPPDYDRPPIRLGMDGKQDSSSDLYAQPAVLDDFLADVHRVGIDVNLAGDGSSHKATIGGIVRLGDISYAITVSHVFKQPPDVGRASADCEFEFDLDTDNYMSGDATSSIEITSRGSKTPESLASGDYTDSVSDLSDVDNLLVTTIVASPNEVSDGYIPPSTTQGTNEAYSALINDTQIRIKLGYQGFDSSPKDVLGNLAMSSINGSHSGLDWALVEIRLPHVLGMLGAYSNTSPPQPQRVAISGPKNARVIARTRSAGVMKGLLSGTPTFTTAPGSQTFQEVWTVALDGPIAEGDCGSWIVDAITGDLYGHIVSGSPESGKAYIVPAYQVFEDIKRQTGADLAFPKTTNDMLGISIGKQGHFTSDYGNSQSISNATISYPIAAPVAVISLLGVVALRLFFLSRGSEWSELLYVVFLLPLLLFAAAVIPESLPLLSTSPSHLKRRHPTDSTSDYISLITNLGESALYWSLQCLGMAFLTNYITRVAVSFLPATQPFTTNLASGMVPGLFAITIFSNTVGIKIYGRFESVVTWLKIVFLFALWTSSRFEHGPIVPGISLSHFLLPETGSLQVVENYVFAYGNLDITYNTILQSHIARDMLIAWTIMTLAVYVMIGLYITEEIVSFRQSSQIPKWFRYSVPLCTGTLVFWICCLFNMDYSIPSFQSPWSPKTAISTLGQIFLAVMVLTTGNTIIYLTSRILWSMDYYQEVWEVFPRIKIVFPRIKSLWRSHKRRMILALLYISLLGLLLTSGTQVQHLVASIYEPVRMGSASPSLLSLPSVFTGSIAFIYGAECITVLRYSAWDTGLYPHGIYPDNHISNRRLVSIGTQPLYAIIALVCCILIAICGVSPATSLITVDQTLWAGNYFSSPMVLDPGVLGLLIAAVALGLSFANHKFQYDATTIRSQVKPSTKANSAKIPPTSRSTPTDQGYCT